AIYTLSYTTLFRSEIDQPRRLGRDPGRLVDQPEGVRRPRPDTPFVVVRKELGLQGRHVHVDRAVVGAALAGKAEVERLEDLVVAPEVELLAIQHLPKQVRAAAGRVLLLAGDH